jgi:molecular chaperone DnaK (HSP70)
MTNANSLLMRVQRDVARERGLRDIPRHFVGIDLGTTNSTAAVLDAEALYRGEHARLIRLVPIRQETDDGLIESPILPSVIAQVAGTWRIGQGARDCRRQGMTRRRNIFYSTKSEMGLGREPYYPLAASKDCDAPYKVAGMLLEHMRGAIEAEAGAEALANTVISVPASFQLAARRDTLRAAGIAHLRLAESGLLDEPNAALLDYLLTVQLPAKDRRLDLTNPRAVLVFDFGGGTCDVSIARVQGDGGALSVATLAISRYERLGGDNIDGAIAEDVLLPALLKQNGLGPLDFTWTEKRDCLMPQLLPAAEALKRTLCGDRRNSATSASYSVDLPVGFRRPAGSTCVLSNPSLTRAQFEAALGPFLDRDFLFTRGSELNPVTSIFTPITDALTRARLEAKDVDAVLFAGGSSLIPEVQRAVGRFFKDATLLTFPDAERTLSAVARGAALHAFFLHGIGRPLLRPIAQETVGILAGGKRFVRLIPAGTELPYPPDGSHAQFADLVVPRDLMREVQIVVAADSAEKILEVARLEVREVKSGGEPIAVHYRLDANKVLEVRAALAADPSATCTVVLENPLCSTGLKSQREQRILELEEDARSAEAQGTQAPAVTEELAQLCLEESRWERALDWARKTLAARRKADPVVLNTMGIAYQRLGDMERAESAYREATRVEPGFASGWFNLALVLKNQGRIDEALSAARRATELRPSSGSNLALHAFVMRQAGQGVKSEARYREAARLLDDAGLSTDFDRAWRVHVAEALNDSYRLAQLEDERKAARPATAPLPYDPEKLPGLRGGVLVTSGE